MKTWKTLRDCRLKGDSVHHAMLGIARLHNLALAGRRGNKQPNAHVVDHLRDSAQSVAYSYGLHEVDQSLVVNVVSR
ncbi:hypothetical protein M2162_000138 [Streptomyces sp. SAI-041]|nr:hypothetical protein [Streptomyces sp. SAI-041]